MKAVLIDNLHDPMKVYNKHMPFLKGWEFVHLSPPFIKSAHDYNMFLTSLTFWKSLKCEWALIIQHDSGILREGIDAFLELGCSFIGAPIKHIPFPAMNGGFSLRKVEDHIKVLENHSYRHYRHNEDIFFTEKLSQMGYKMPTIEQAKNFSVETIFNLGSFGFHACDKYLTPSQVNQVYTQYD